jgi:hypothetical protein
MATPPRRFPQRNPQKEESCCSGTSGVRNRETLLAMTLHKAKQTGLSPPSPLDRWINALLRSLAMLVSFVASICSMRLTRRLAECHSDATPEALPCTESGKLKETTKAAANSQLTSAIRPTNAPRFNEATPTMLLPRAGEARRALTDQRARSGGGPPSRPCSAEEVTAPPVPHQTAHAATPLPASLPRSGEEHRGCFNS